MNSYLKRILISNVGPFGFDPISIQVSNLVCLVGINNCGKSTVLDCYELAIRSAPLPMSKLNHAAKADPYVEMWVEIPSGTPNVADKWIDKNLPDYKGMDIVRTRWTWKINENLSCERQTFDSLEGKFSSEGKAGGLDSVFTSRLPKPIRIGALDRPEKDSLIELILDPIIRDLKAIEKDPQSSIFMAIGEVQEAVSKEITRYDNTIKEVQSELDGQFGSVFEDSRVSISIAPAEELISIEKSLRKSTELLIGETEKFLPMNSQGTGAQRTLFWSLLKVRTAIQNKLENQRSAEKQMQELQESLSKHLEKVAELEARSKRTEKQNVDLEFRKNQILEIERNISHPPQTFQRGHILMIDEPEIALHPSAVRAAKEQLYALAEEAGWQVMMTTHHPAFIDPTKPHTTIVRVNKSKNEANTFQSDIDKFNEDEKNELSALLRFDMAFSEIFFAKEVYVVEGDTEYALLHENFSILDLAENKKNKGRVVVRAGGKGPIPLILRILRQFNIPHFVLHDVDAPLDKNKKANGQYSLNEAILKEVKLSLTKKINVIHRVSVPNFESALGIKRSRNGKPIDAIKFMKADATFSSTIKSLISELNGSSKNQAPGENYESLLKEWIKVNNITDERYTFK